MSLSDLTEIQGDLYRVIRDEFGGTATTIQLRHRLEYGSTEAVKYHLTKLEDAGLIDLSGGERTRHGTNRPIKASTSWYAENEITDRDIPGTGDTYETELLRHRVDQLEQENEELQDKLNTLNSELEELRDYVDMPDDPLAGEF